MDPHDRLQQLLRERGWTEYRLSKECGLAQSTIGNIFRRNTVPSIATLETICKGFGITLSQFFTDENLVELSPELKELFDAWVCLKPNQKEAALLMLKAMRSDTKQDPPLMKVIRFFVRDYPEKCLETVEYKKRVAGAFFAY